MISIFLFQVFCHPLFFSFSLFRTSFYFILIFSLKPEPLSLQSLFMDGSKHIPGAKKFKNIDEMTAVVLQRRLETVSLSICLSVYLSIYLSIYFCFCLSICLSVSLVQFVFSLVFLSVFAALF